MGAEPRSIQDQLTRDSSDLSEHVSTRRTKTKTLVCPRCGWACDHLVVAYYESVWNEHGGICSQCIIEAAQKYDRDGWPEVPEPQEEEPEQPKERASEQTTLV